MGTGQLAGEVRRRVQEADPAAVVRRNAKVEKERRVSLRPAPDTMVYLTGLLPMGRGISAFATLSRDAEALISAGNERSKGQIMADLLIERLTGETASAELGVNVDLVLSDTTLLGGGNTSATIPGHGPVPAQIARELVAHALRAETISWIRTLYADPTRRLVAMSTRQRFATDGLADYLDIRDQRICRTPWCDAPARQADHIQPASNGGETTADNLQYLCQACNLAKQADGWTQRVIDDPTDNPTGRHTVETTTPTGHRHRSTAPAPPQPARQDQQHRHRHRHRHRQPTVITTELYRPAFDLDHDDSYNAA